MKNTGICPKCESRNVFGSGRYGSAAALEINMFNYAKTRRYVCCNCGFVEEWVADSQEFQKLRDKYLK